jgi:splicing factor 3B subunit 1
VSDWDAVEATPSVSRWDATPGPATEATPGRWDQTPGAGSRWDATPGRADGATPGRRNRWDETPTPGRVSSVPPQMTSSVPLSAAGCSVYTLLVALLYSHAFCLQMDGGATPGWAAGETPAVGATGQKQRSRWDETPAAGAAAAGGATPGLGATPAWGGATPAFGVTPVGGIGMETPDVNQLPKVPPAGMRTYLVLFYVPAVSVCSACLELACAVLNFYCLPVLQVPMTAEQYQMARWEREMDERNRPLTDEELDTIIPKEGYRVMPEPPVGCVNTLCIGWITSVWLHVGCNNHLQSRCLLTAVGKMHTIELLCLNPMQGYAPIRTPARKLMSTPTPFGGTPMYSIPEENRSQTYDVPQQLEGLPDMKPEDQQYFGALLKVRPVRCCSCHHYVLLRPGRQARCISCT